jgi:SAM-dependent methyltransferase
MLGMGRWLFPADQIVLVRGIGEVLAFRDGSFDRVTCKGALDHFVDPHAFMREAARVLRPEGRVVIALANFESLSCRLGRFRERLVRPFLRNGRPRRVYWEVHYDHYHKGELSFVQQLGGNWLQLERCYGLSLFWQFPRWGALLDHLPAPSAKGLWLSLDRIAYRAPSMADMIISVWRRYPAAGEARRHMSEQAGRGQGGSANPLP